MLQHETLALALALLNSCLHQKDSLDNTDPSYNNILPEKV